MAAVDFETASKEVTGWLDYKKVKASTRESYKAQIDMLIESVQDGTITIDPTTFAITHNLAVPVAGIDLTTLEYKPRLTVGEKQRMSEKVKAVDIDGQIVATIAALTGKGMETHIKKLDTEDYKISQSIAVFFI